MVRCATSKSVGRSQAQSRNVLCAQPLALRVLGQRCHVLPRVGWQNRCVMDLSSFDAQSARDASFIAMVVGVLGVLLVLKFVSSLVTKLLLTALFGVVIYFGFTQRDELSACIATIQANVERGDSSDVTCSFLGRDVTVEIPFNIKGG